MLSREEKKEIIRELKDELNQTVEIELVRDIELPHYSKPGDAGCDVRSSIDIEIKPQETVLIPLGFKLNIPEGYEIQVRPRSGISLKTPLRIANAPGTIDSGYKDELCVIMTNTSISNNGIYTLDDKNGEGVYKIGKGDRIAQLVLSKYEVIKFKQVSKVDDSNNRGGGFGHTGVN